MKETLNLKILDLFCKLHDLTHGERGQTTGEYVAITAVGVALALGVVFGLFQSQLTSAVNAIGGEITDFIAAN
jgi:hypothetical protein